ncbi:MAG TPA: PepSY domain-containing protein [Gemmatimonadaceae bacterium]|nr:PepSY domain-containing protein [Gemmatimonadaceae bacterium]
MFRSAMSFAATLLAATSLGAQQPPYKRHVPAALLKQAKVSESAAVQTALHAVHGARIDALELEHEDGHLQYSFDMKTPGRDGIDEVNVDAITGKVIGKPQHESAADERAEAAAEKTGAARKPGGGR